MSTIVGILERKFKKWIQDISSNITVLPRAIPLKFEDASILAKCAAVYAVVYQSSITNKRLLVSKSRISKKDVTIPRLGLMSAHLGQF